MEILFCITVCLAFLYAEGRALVRYAHMFQLSSYQYPGYTKSLKRTNKNYPFIIVSFFVLSALTLLFRGNTHYFALFFVFMLFSLILRPITGSKIKLVYTDRVKRLFTTSYVILSLYCAVAILLGVSVSCILLYVMICAMYAIAPCFILLANLINTPIEKNINKGFIDEARDMLADSPKLSIIGITGSFGKTSMKFYLKTLLTEDYNLLIPPGNYNTTLGVVRTIRENMRGYHNMYLCEMGARHVGDIKEICDLVNPDFGVITSIGNQHLETFKTLENVRRTKLELADSVDKKGGTVIINADSVTDIDKLPYKHIITYGTSGLHDYAVYDIHANELGMSFMIRCKKTGECVPFKTQLLGMHNAINIVGAVAVANTLGISMRKLAARTMKISAVEHRLEVKATDTEVIIDDAYNSNPSGASAALDALEYFSTSNYNRILITPGMVELGSRQAEENTKFGEHAAKVCDYVIIVGRTNAESIKAGLVAGGFDESAMKRRVYTAMSFNDAMRRAKSRTVLGKKNVILIENDLPDNY